MEQKLDIKVLGIIGAKNMEDKLLQTANYVEIIGGKVWTSRFNTSPNMFKSTNIVSIFFLIIF